MRLCQVLGLSRIARLVAGIKAAAPRPRGGCRGLALGQQQPRPLRRDGVEHAGHAPARAFLLGLAHGIAGACGIALGLADPGQGGQARGGRLREDELPARRDSLGQVSQRGVELATLIGPLGQPHVGDACGGQPRLAGRGGDFQRLLVGVKRRVEVGLGALDLGEMITCPYGQEALPDRGQTADAGRQGVLGLGKSPAQPLGHAQVPAGDGAERVVAGISLGQGLAAEGQLAVGVAVQLSQERPDPAGRG